MQTTMPPSGLPSLGGINLQLPITNYPTYFRKILPQSNIVFKCSTGTWPSGT